MQLDPTACFRAFAARDRRFEGRFFLGVTTTGIYCRPGCPARLPKPENVRFYPTATAAEMAGFRACARCRPSALRGSAAAMGTSATVARALRLIESGGLDATRVDALAERLGIGERQLRRLFSEHLGAPPAAIARSRRLHFARALVEETAMPMTEVALAAGFTSQRRFNEAMQASFGRTPTVMRRARRAPEAGEGVALRVKARPPYDFAALLGFLGPRCIPGVERVDGDVYLRTVRPKAANEAGVVRVRASGDAAIEVRVRGVASADLFDAIERVGAMFDVDADGDAIGRHLEHDAALAPLVAERPGLRVPGAWDTFELVVRAILGQQVSVVGATTLSGRLAEAYGERAATGVDGLRLLFPTPERLADADVERIGLPRARAETIRVVARAAARGELDPNEGLQALPGIGPWTAAYVAMRAGRDPDAFPAGDLGLRKAVGGARGPASEAEVERASAAWRPFRAYAAMHLWSKKGEAR